MSSTFQFAAMSLPVFYWRSPDETLSLLFCLLMSLCLSSQPAKAQYGGGPPPHWHITYDNVGAFSQSAVNASGQPVSIPDTNWNFQGQNTDAPQNNSSNSRSISGAYSSVIIHYTNTITVHARYEDYQGNLAPNPPATAYFLRNGMVRWQASATHSGSIRNGYPGSERVR